MLHVEKGPGQIETEKTFANFVLQLDIRANSTDPNFHPRAGLPKVDCRACHAAKPPENVYPANATEILAARNLARPAQKFQKGDGWMGTPHGKAWLEGKEGAPSCASCHTAHYVRKAKDPESTVNRDNLPETCGKCHKSKVDLVAINCSTIIA